MTPQANNALAPSRRIVNPAIMDKIAHAQRRSVRHPNVRDGLYLWEVRQVLSEDKRKGHCFIIELGVIHSRPTDDPERAGVVPNPVQTLVGSVVLFAGGGVEAAPGNVQSFILGLLGVDYDGMSHADGALMTVDEKAAEIKSTYADLVSEAQPARGMLVAGSTFCSKIKTGPNAGNDFVGINWQTVANNETCTAARRRFIDAGSIGSPLSQEEQALTGR